MSLSIIILVINGPTTSYELGTIGPDKRLYIDRDYTFDSWPTALTGADYIRTENNHKNAVAVEWLAFDVKRNATVYVALDQRKIPDHVPAWLDSWEKTSWVIETTDATFQLYSKGYPAGRVSLGGNEGPGDSSMYFVIAKDSGGPPWNKVLRAPRGLKRRKWLDISQ